MAATRASSGGSIPLRRVLKEPPPPPPPPRFPVTMDPGRRTGAGGDYQVQNAVLWEGGSRRGLNSAQESLQLTLMLIVY